MSSTSDRTASLEPIPIDPQASGLRFDVFATRVLYIVTFALGAVSTAQGDLWWLLRAGRDVWRTGHVTLTERYSHTAEGRYWPNHEWLWEATAYALHHVGGMPLLEAWTGAIVAGTAWVMRHNSRAVGYVVPVVLGIALPLTSVVWTIRPQVTSMLLFAVTMRLLAQERYLLIPPLLLLWANLHAQVGMGGVLLVAALAAALLALMRDWTPPAGKRALLLLASTVAGAVATLATPLGARLWSYVLDAKGRPAQDGIAEWTATFHSATGAAILFPVLVVTLVLGVRRRDRLRSWSDRVPAVAALVTAPLAILAIRNIPFFLVAAVPLLMTLLEFRTIQPIGTVRHWRRSLAGFALVTAAVVALAWVAQPARLRWHPVPGGLATALRECPGPLYNNYDDGAALIWFVPDVKVFADNRFDPYPDSVIDLAMRLTPKSSQQGFRTYGIRCALLRRDSPVVTAIEKDGWTTTYEDATSVLLVPPTGATE